jgi:hypothetical protein
VLWADDNLREQILAEGAVGLGDAERELVASWRHRVSSSFIVFRHLKKHSIFLSKSAYAVLGIYTPLEVMLAQVPMYVNAVLLPFRDVIITDGTIESPGLHISFGGGARRIFREQYNEARDDGRIVTALPAPIVPETAAANAVRTVPPKRKRPRSR